MNLASASQLIVAASDLHMVRLIRGAIAENNVGQPRAEVHPKLRGGAVVEPQPKLKPAPEFAPRPVHVPEPEFRPVADCGFDAPVVEGKRPVEPAFGPLPAPWQVLLREKVWNRPVAAADAARSGNGAVRSPAGASFADATTAAPATGRLVDAFL